MKYLGLLFAAVFILAGCASSKSGDVYTRDQARREQSVRMGVVESVRDVQLEGTKSPVGSVAGAAVGGIAGSTIGHGRGSTVGAVLGAVAGGLAGSAIEEGVTRRQAMEITVRTDDGRIIAIVQEGDSRDFRPGDRVRLLSAGGETRVTR